jgi:hypothetical protein
MLRKLIRLGLTRSASNDAQYARLQRIGFVYTAIATLILLAVVGFGSLIAPGVFNPLYAVLSIFAWAWTTLLLIFAIRRSRAIWPTALLQVTTMLIVGTISVCLATTILMKAFFFLITGMVVANGIAKLASD